MSVFPICSSPQGRSACDPGAAVECVSPAGSDTCTDSPLVRDVLTALAQLQAPSGKIQGRLYGPNLTTEETPNLNDFRLWLILALHDYVLDTGDLDTLRDLSPALDRLLIWAQNRARPDGLLDKGTGPDWYWTWPNRDGETIYFNALYSVDPGTNTITNRYSGS